MLKKGEVVVYGSRGLCMLKDIAIPPFLSAGKEKLYYQLSSASDKSAVLYVPVDGGEDKMRDVISEEEAKELMDHLEEMDSLSVSTGKKAEAEIAEVVKRNDAPEMLALVKGLYKLRIERTQNGKKLASMNERYLSLSEKLLYPELAFALKTEVDKVKKMVTGTLNRVLQEAS
ncbi:MAG: hypothetical protein HXK92_02410 [Lachnospiraceae bacterium]|nr:hypothetical protein [Lachnospiraceae bacterium]MBF1004744.1 hypothetical protein [Lachnospiraceae bacterium]MBF1040508.1 hypothetical protein [Lachnospiraceae bacterium]